MRHVAIVFVAIFGFVAPLQYVSAGTTGAISGVVYESGGNTPIANARITVTSPSEKASGTTDASGHFAFISLSPDTYTISLAKDGYEPASQGGVSVFADATQTLTLYMLRGLQTIARVSSRAASDLVKSGTTADVYSVTAATQSDLSALGGGGNLNSAYAAVSSMPGVYEPMNQSGYFQTVQIRGGNEVGYELDGVPVNRSFDNFPSGALSSLGMQELQVYTGATPANSEGQGLAGYINQVIKTGTSPGLAQAALGIGTPTFYHKTSIEVGGATPDRMFSYYVGIGGYNQDFRYVNSTNAAGYADLGPALLPPVNCPATPDINNANCYASGVGPGGFILAPYPWALQASIADRDVIANLHFRIPHKHDGGSDDVQFLWDSGMLFNSFYESTSDAGGYGIYGGIANAPTYSDGYQYTGPVGQIVSTSQLANTVIPYFFPSSPSHAFDALIPLQNRDTTWNDQEIVKLQYQKNFASSAYFRIYGYTYYSDWLQDGPVCGFSSYGCFASPDYEVSSHTRGVSATFSDQLDAQNLLSLQASYTTATSLRDNNTQMYNSGGSSANFAVLVDPNHPMNGVCYSVVGGVGKPTTCEKSAATWLKLAKVYNGNIPDHTGSTCGSGPCSYFVAENSLDGSYNNVTPQFSSFSITDQWRPNDRLLVNLGLRFDRFQFDGSDTSPNDPARQFWFSAFNTDECIANATGIPFDKVISLGLASPTDACPAGYSVPNLQNVSAQVQTYAALQPRLAFTYTLNPTTVLRASYGIYVEPPSTSGEQYNTLQENLASYLGTHFYQYGFTTPSHDEQPQTSDNYDLSLEKSFGRDWSMKITPFYRKTKNQVQAFYLDQATGFASGLNVGSQTSQGVEFELNKGDFNRDGLSGELSFTYTNSYINYGLLPNGLTIVSQINNDIRNYNAYTSACASGASNPRCGSTSNGASAAACYTASGTPDSTCASGDIANPYWNAPLEATIDPSANYPTYATFPGGVGGSADAFSVPYTATLILNYKRGRVAFTPSLQFQGGNSYGSPESMVGIDPAGGCAPLAGASLAGDPRYQYGAPGGAPFDALTCAGTMPVPDRFTQSFDLPGSFRNPSQIMANLQVRYDLSPKITLVGTFANLLNRCFGGTKNAWTIHDSNVCSYNVNNSVGYIPPDANVYNPGATFQRLVEYPYAAYLSPVNTSAQAANTNGSTLTPFNFYLEVQIKL
jgi:hypothetical protein